jgi:hypothetical protein
MIKTCNQCGQAKPLEEFTRSNRSNSFKYSKATTHTYCKACNADRAREWRKKHANYKGSGRINAVPKEDRILMSAIRQLITDARGRCKKLKRPEPVLTDAYLYELFLKQDRSCALTGAPLSLVTDDPLRLSLAQIEPEKGYIEGNVQWLAWCVNRAKGDFSLDQFYEICEFVLDYRKGQSLSKGVELAA